MSSVHGIHHLTAICGDPQQNIDFHVDVLGLRMVKLSVNHDDPTAYHLYYGDKLGSPGSLLTFFPYPGPGGRRGNGQVTLTHLRIPDGSAAYWRGRLADYIAPGEDESVIDIADPDGLLYRLHEGAPGGGHIVPWEGSDVPLEYQIRGMAAVTEEVRDEGPTKAVLQRLLGFTEDPAPDYPDHVMRSGEEAVFVKLGTGGPGRSGPGTVHHIAFRVGNDEAQLNILEDIRSVGLPASDVRERYYFKSIYFREPGGVLYEIATDGPGMTFDEPLDELGTRLTLPPFLESRRAEIEAGLPKLNLPKSNPNGAGQIP